MLVKSPVLASSWTANRYSFHTFFASVRQDAVNQKVERAYVSAIEGISNMPSPFVKYCYAIWNYLSSESRSKLACILPSRDNSQRS